MQPVAQLPSLWLACGLDCQGWLGRLISSFWAIFTPWKLTTCMLVLLLAVAEIVDTSLPHETVIWSMQAIWPSVSSSLCKAVADNGSHAMVGLVAWQAADPTWLPPAKSRANTRGLPRRQGSRPRWLLERAAALLSGSVIDVDHFVAAR